MGPRLPPDMEAAPVEAQSPRAWATQHVALTMWSETVPGMGSGLSPVLALLKGFSQPAGVQGDTVKGIRGSVSPHGVSHFPHAGSISCEQQLGRPWEPRSPGICAENPSSVPITVTSKVYEVLGQGVHVPQNSNPMPARTCRQRGPWREKRVSSKAEVAVWRVW